ncbi:MAG: zinc-dependent metalloprotease [Kofleriaceae bacterium]|nr:zinc-dependent metalloprotease [Kofleriaceae bacterium]
MKLGSVLGVFMVAASCTGCHDRPPPVAPSPPTDGGLKPWAEALADTERIDGLIPVHLREDGAPLLELHAADLDHDLGLIPSLSRGTGVGYVIDGTALGDTELIQLRRVGGKVYVVRRDPVAWADTGGAGAIAAARDPGDSVLAAMPVVSEGADGAVLVDATDWWLTEPPELVDSLLQFHAATPDTAMPLDRARSFVERVRGFPRNLEIDATLTYAPAKVPVRVPASPADGRAISVTVRWSLFALPDVPMTPRHGDDRIGYFAEVRQDLDNVDVRTVQNNVDLIHRRRLDKRDPTAAVSPPVEPIRYYLDPSIPEAYRPFVKEGVLAWNRAFEAAGIKDAIVVEDAPVDFDYADMRYSSIHWSNSSDPGYIAYGPSQIDPRSGEILNADVIVIADVPHMYGVSLRPLPGRAGGCAAPSVVGEHLLIGNLLAAAGGARVDLDALIGPIIRWLTMHEVGHTLGLRHNFHGSADVPAARLHDRDWTAVHGLTASVMDYPAINVAPDGVAQGDYETPTLGDYDVLAIRYGYTPVAGDAAAEEAALQDLGAQATADGLAYATDEDNWLGDWAVDPWSSAFDLGDDPVGFATQRVALLDQLAPYLADALIPDGESYAPVREALVATMASRTSVLRNALKVVGGAEVRRRHRGDAGTPVTPVPAATQRRALALVLQQGLGDSAYAIPDDVLALAPPRRDRQLGTINGQEVPVDLPVHALVLAQQDGLLGSLLSAPRLQRLVDNADRDPDGHALTVAEVLATTTRALFTELDGAHPVVNSYRRGVQRAYVVRLLALTREPDAPAAPPGGVLDWNDHFHGAPPQLPADARALARAELVALRKRASAVASKGGDAETRAHLEELAALIARTLDAAPALAPAAPAAP